MLDHVALPKSVLTHASLWNRRPMCFTPFIPRCPLHRDGLSGMLPLHPPGFEMPWTMKASKAGQLWAIVQRICTKNQVSNIIKPSDLEQLLTSVSQSALFISSSSELFTKAKLEFALAPVGNSAPPAAAPSDAKCLVVSPHSLNEVQDHLLLRPSFLDAP